MTKGPIVTDDKAIMAVRKAIKAIEPRPTPVNTRLSPWGHKQLQCPDCGEWCYAKNGSYNHHWTLRHGTPFWREQHVIKAVKRYL